MNESTVWILKRGSEKKFRSGHPWVFSSELAQSPKGIAPGGLVELRDFHGGFLARGYGHPNSQISFRTLTLQSSAQIDVDFFVQRFLMASRIRQIGGVRPFSHRLCFAEGDHVPGLIIDRYRLTRTGQRRADSQAFVIQSSTAGMDRLLPMVFEAIERLVAIEKEQESGAVSWDATSLILANDSKARLNEGLASEPKKLIRSASGLQPENCKMLAEPSLLGLEPVIFEVDLINGQKTGFFLDQRLNVRLSAPMVESLARRAMQESRVLRILDLFCYVGQWGTQLAHIASTIGAQVEVTLVDASVQALNFAARNVENHGGLARIEKRDVLDELGAFERKHYDVVICDPPAFVKKKKDLPTGGQAYFKVNREAIRKVRPGGLFVSCSCSGLFDEAEFRSMLARVSAGFDGRISWLARGSHGVDHPQRPEFPQGTYLKSWLGVVEQEATK